MVQKIMKGKTLHIFVRFGGVNLKKQKGYSTEPRTYHSPPAPKGFYAMPKIAQELFLISSMDKYQPSTVPKEKQPPEGLSDSEEQAFWDNLHKRREKAISSMRKEFSKPNGNVWHHLGEYTNRNEIIGSHGTWVKTSIQAWEKAFSKMSINHRYGCGDKYFSVKSINDARGVVGIYSKDHCEVFFDEKV
jgi:hypothetical protein